MIKTILFATVVAFGTTAALAGTVKLPGSYLGDWCLSESAQNGGGQPYTMLYRRASDCPAEDRITIRANGIYYQAECKTVKSSGSSRYGYVMTYRCKSEENNGILKMEMSLDDENLIIESRQRHLPTKYWKGARNGKVMIGEFKLDKPNFEEFAT
jgi:hypothetical protein